MFHPSLKGYPIFHLGESLLNCLPVDDVPDGTEVFRLAVLVLKTKETRLDLTSK